MRACVRECARAQSSLCRCLRLCVTESQCPPPPLPLPPPRARLLLCARACKRSSTKHRRKAGVQPRMKTVGPDSLSIATAQPIGPAVPYFAIRCSPQVRGCVLVRARVLTCLAAERMRGLVHCEHHIERHGARSAYHCTCERASVRACVSACVSAGVQACGRAGEGASMCVCTYRLLLQRMQDGVPGRLEASPRTWPEKQMCMDMCVHMWLWACGYRYVHRNVCSRVCRRAQKCVWTGV